MVTSNGTVCNLNDGKIWFIFKRIIGFTDHSLVVGYPYSWTALSNAALISGSALTCSSNFYLSSPEFSMIALNLCWASGDRDSTNATLRPTTPKNWSFQRNSCNFSACSSLGGCPDAAPAARSGSDSTKLTNLCWASATLYEIKITLEALQKVLLTLLRSGLWQQRRTLSKIIQRLLF